MAYRSLSDSTAYRGQNDLFCIREKLLRKGADSATVVLAVTVIDLDGTHSAQVVENVAMQGVKDHKVCVHLRW